MSTLGQVRLVAGREISTRARDKGFILSSLVIVLLVVGVMIFQLVSGGTTSSTTIGVVGGNPSVTTALQQSGEAAGTEVTVTDLDDEAAARQAVEDGDVDAAVLDPTGDSPTLVVEASSDDDGIVRSAVSALSVAAQLAEQGVELQPAPQLTTTELDPADDDRGPAVVVALLGVVVLYGLLILFGQFVAQGVVEEKSSRVVELLLSTMKPWQLLAGKILGLGVLGLVQLVLIAVVGVTGALALDVVSVPGQLIGTVLTVIAWFLVGYAFYASVFAAAASLVSRQEDLGSVLTPTTLLLVVGFIVSLQAAQDPGSTLATVTSFVPGLSPLVMPVRMAAGEAAWWEVAVSVAIMLAAIALVVRIGGRVYAGALLRTGGRTKLREALKAERA
ncbi:ABC-2 type transport system permease protein [Klenkia marina]|uniref:ABC-2 type transport system permease protein n=1 Tax=Klenkia marina TaxID=1960309 RepID=A0A1G4XD77_9ACTN|nr:ABC transporter permease [Klenkia marina]SCX38944.1 ABC-2 type transport system permease protein [Klenkia marina]